MLELLPSAVFEYVLLLDFTDFFSRSVLNYFEALQVAVAYPEPP